MAKKLGLILGIVFVLVGILGFMGTGIVGPEGMFMTNTLHDLVHLVTGLVFIIVALKAVDSVGVVFKVFGIVYLLVAILGFMMVGENGMGSILGLLDVNSADNWLHLVLGVVILALGFKVGKKAMSASSMPMGGM